MTLDYGPYTGWFGRIGVDISRRFGPIIPVVDAYLSLDGIVRRELRMTLPFGFAS